MSKQLFQLDQQWCRIHYPERPNGFAVMVLGDHHHYVDEKSSFWLQQDGRAEWIQELTNKGYLVFYSNLFGPNWGSNEAVQLALRLYQHVKRNEIINGKIHILAEGMGALVFKNLYPKMKDDLRSAVLLSPCVSLYEHFQQEREQKFFYKKLVKEVSEAFQIREKDCLSSIKKEVNDHMVFNQFELPIYIIQWTSLNRYKNQFSLVKEIYKERVVNSLPTDLFYVLPEKRYSIGRKFISYFTLHEKVL
jgi:hypothetical protein